MAQSTINSDVFINGNLASLTMTPPAASIPSSALQVQSVTAAKLSVTLATGFIWLDLFAARALAAGDVQNKAAVGGLLAKDSDPILERINLATDKGLRVKWAAGSVVELQLPPFPYPADLDSSQPVIVSLRGRMGGSTNTAAFTVAYFEGVGGTDKGGVTGALGPAEANVTRTVNAVAAPPQFVSVSITPAAHATDTVELHAAWCTYTRM